MEQQNTFFVELYLGLMHSIVEEHAPLLTQRGEVSRRVEQVAHAHTLQDLGRNKQPIVLMCTVSCSHVSRALRCAKVDSAT